MNITKPIITSILLSSFFLGSCKEEKKEEIIIVKTEKPSVSKQRTNIAMEPEKSDFAVAWNGVNMNISIKRSADSTLTLVKEEGVDGDTYYDNRINLTVKRQDGSEFFSKEFTKERFKEFINKSQYSKYVLYNMRHHDNTANSMDFVVNVGEPNESSDNSVNVLVSINKQGVMSLKPFAISEKADDDEEMLEP